MKNNNENNTISIVGFILSFIIPVVGLILSIIGLSKSKELNNKGKGLSISGIIISSIMLIFNFIFTFSIIEDILNESDNKFEYKYDNKKDYNNDNNNEDNDTSQISYEGKKGDLFCIEKSSNYYISKCNNSTNKSYTCTTNNCKIFDVSENGRFIVGYDNNEYFTYDYNTNKKTKLNIDLIKYKKINILAEKNDENLIGLFLTKDDNKSNLAGYYDLKENKMLIDYKDYSYLTSDYISVKKSLFIFQTKEDKTGLMNINTGQLLLENVNTSEIVNDKVYFYYFVTDDEYFTTITNLYNENLKEIYKGNAKRLNIYDNKIILTDIYNLSDNNIYMIYEDEVLKYISKKYNDIFFINSDYIVVNENNKLIVKRIDETYVTTLTELKTDYYVRHAEIRKVNGKDAIVIPMTNEREYTDKEIEEYKKNNPKENIKYTCYHYYYIMSTGEKGRYIDYTDMI